MGSVARASDAVRLRTLAPWRIVCEGREDCAAMLAAARALAARAGGALREESSGRYSVCDADGAILLALELSDT